MSYSILKSDSIEIDFDGRKILQGVYLECKQGEVLGLLGRNGCGKSTLLKIIFGSVTPSHKYVSIDGVYVNKGYTNGQIAYLPQHHYLPTGVKIISLAKQIIDPLVWDEFAAYPIYQTYFNKTVNDISGGEWRQLEMLMVLYSKAKFILLDEPFTHISPIQVEEFKGIITARAKTRGIIVTDHYYRNVLEVSDRLLLLNNGYTQMISNQADLVTYGYLSV
ncbi:ABC-type lipopolysaccharide export system ATPase subunit [Mucilaginibacter gracilis]|uniref:ABC-type lipopolysaccharide export system ATPase subunit n=1 Tax=Mucilaginibacter gracilis TaxID=423350 RepID=A0A495J956_9SPHI|nr:ATP-binding cassette domain-containing protein [Mucilaginibacter gracilis]RKR85437.1 ABC-type lipopolysaccharide export system ATPase subunit [Mucilaginibacter gracilis]